MDNSIDNVKFQLLKSSIDLCDKNLLKSILNETRLDESYKNTINRLLNERIRLQLFEKIVIILFFLAIFIYIAGLIFDNTSYIYYYSMVLKRWAISYVL